MRRVIAILSIVLIGYFAGCESVEDARNLDRPQRVLPGAYNEARETMRQQGVTGQAIVRITIETDGSVSHAELYDATNAAVGRIALASALRWRLTPPTEKGRPVRATELLEIRSPLSSPKADAPTRADFASFGFTGRFFVVASVAVIPHRTENPPPEYPPDLLDARIQGRAEVAWIVETDGTVHETHVISASRPEFGDAAAAWARSQQFRPGLRGGEPVRVAMKQVVMFTIGAPR
ncbi:MAG TPA: energy transducer TonB [Opitutaceae bacterium]|nr:energy transducer TonB [Opitutaceae bacterium]